MVHDMAFASSSQSLIKRLRVQIAYAFKKSWLGHYKYL